MARCRTAVLCVALVCCRMGAMWLAGAQDAPEYPTIAAAMSGLGLTMASAFLTVANLTSLLQDPTTNVVMLVPTNAALQKAIADYGVQKLVQDSRPVRSSGLLQTIPQPPGTVHGALALSDALILDTLLTNNTEFSDALNSTLTRLTFKDNGDGRWYVGGSIPGALLDLKSTHTAANGRVYLLDGMLAAPSNTIKPPDLPANLYSMALVLESVPELSTYLTLAQADAEVWPLLAPGSDLCTTIFPPDNAAWATYFSSTGTTLDAFKGTPAAHDLLAASILTNRPYMVQQLPAGLTEARDLLGRTFQITCDGKPDPNNTVSLIGTRNLGGVYILPAPLRNIRGGKSVMHAVGVVPIPDNSTLPGAPGSDAATAAPAPGTNDTSGSSSNKTGLIVGLAVGITAGVALLALAAVLWWRRTRLRTKAARASFGLGKAGKDAGRRAWPRLTVDVDGAALVSPAHTGPHMDIPGVHQGMFTRMVAYEYSWTDIVPQPGQCVAVESGVNDRQLDSLMKGEGATQDCPVVKLTRQDVKEQVQLLRHGVLGKGATAMVFQCVWPSRFGPNALLAAKVLKEGSDADPHHLSSFAYEASVLESLLHPNVVRLYGYCLEPPCVCIILELLPLSLKQLLYDTDAPAPAVLGSPTDSASQNATLTHHSSHPLTSSSLSHAGMKGLLANQPHSSMQGSPASAGLRTPGQPWETKHSAHSVEVTIHEGGGDQPLTAVRKLTVLQVLSISNDIAAGLAHMHNSSSTALQEHSPFEERHSSQQRAKVVHRDLKPANILINSRGQAKISDFGLARQHHQTTIATAHVGAGTLPYMAPELLIHASGQVCAAASATNRVDIYSLAMIMWEMLAGHTPWQGSADAALVIAVTQGRRPPLPDPPALEPPLEPGLLQREAGPEVVPQFNAVVRACWRQRELKRPTAVAVHHKLCQLLTDMGVPTTPQAVLLADDRLAPCSSMAVSLSNQHSMST